jgi:arsenite oxidase small subunit
MATEGMGRSESAGRVSRRNFLVGVGAAAVVGAVVAAGAESLLMGKTKTSVVTSTVAGPTSTVTSTPTASGFPTVKVASLSQLTANNPVNFNYPLADEPNILVMLGQQAQGGVGPNGDIVAFSAVCQHLGCTPQYVAANASPSCKASYQAPSPIGYCCCHGAIYDFVNGGKVLSGPAPLPLPQVLLEVDPNGDIYAYAMGPPTIYGHNTGSSYVSNDLQG